jgi:1,4-alpha-glucan branching enzyme
MLYTHHGLEKAFSGYDDYFNETVDEDALAYLALANEVIHRLRPDAMTVAEDISGMPGLALPVADGGIGFRLPFFHGGARLLDPAGQGHTRRRLAHGQPVVRVDQSAAGRKRPSAIRNLTIRRWWGTKP